MRKLLILILIVSVVGCKKKTPAPTTEPDPDPQPTCQTGATNFTGKYKYMAGNKDTIEIVFLHNNCPDENQNTYKIIGLAKALKPMLKPGGTMEDKDYNIKTLESYNQGNIVGINGFGFNREPHYSDLTVVWGKLYNNTSFFVKIK